MHTHSVSHIHTRHTCVPHMCLIVHTCISHTRLIYSYMLLIYSHETYIFLRKEARECRALLRECRALLRECVNNRSLYASNIFTRDIRIPTQRGPYRDPYIHTVSHIFNDSYKTRACDSYILTRFEYIHTRF